MGRIRIEHLPPDCMLLSESIAVAVMERNEGETGVQDPLNGRGGVELEALGHRQTENWMEGQR